MADAIFTTN